MICQKKILKTGKITEIPGNYAHVGSPNDRISCNPTSEEKCNPKPITIIIGRTSHKVPQPVMTGREIKELGDGPLNYLLVLVIGRPDEVTGGDDKIITDNESIKLKSGMRFRIVNPATFGCER